MAQPAGSKTESLPLSTLPPNLLHDALLLFRKGDFDGAIGKYQQLLSEKQNVPDAYAGLIRSYLKKKNVQQAYDTANQAIQVLDSPPIRVALGEVYFRQGRIHDAEQEWVTVINSGRMDARAYMGVARIRWAMSNYKSGWSLIDKAHAIDPSDPEIQKLWAEKVSLSEHIKFLEQYLAGENNEDAETRMRMQQYLEYLKARARNAPGGCRLVSKTTSTETRLLRLLIDSRRLRGYGLPVEVNGHPSKLLLDTGASGILINRRLAQRAGTTRLSNMPISGIGDKGDKNGYTAVADSLKVGDLEFQGCTVQVLEQRSVTDEDGLIGADVFSSFLVDIDFPSERLRLKELPKRPEDTDSTIRLKTEGEDSEPQKKTADTNAASTTPRESKPVPFGPQDSYVAPEMKSFTKVFRFGHMLLVPTSIGDVPYKLFLLDSGATTNFVTPAAAREVTKVREDAHTNVKGLSGSVNQVYSADKAVLRFGHLRQENQDITAFDFTQISDNLGTEVSGTLGFTLLRLLDLKIDYRDGLVDFSYDPKRWGQ